MDQQRLELLDALRGFAVLMILFANVFAFAYPLELADIAGLTQPQSVVSQLQHQLYLLFVRGKFICLLTLLFGASLYLLSQQGSSAASKVQSRMLALLVIGACHIIFVWSGDVLFIYAVAGMGLALQQVWNRSAEQNLSAVNVYLTAGLALPVLLWLAPSAPDAAPSDTTDLIQSYTGSYVSQLGLQLEYFGLLLLDLVFISYWWFGGIMLLGIWGMQTGWQQQLKKHNNSLLLIALVTGGLPLLWTEFGSEQPVPLPFQLVSDLCFALLYIRFFIFVLVRFPALARLLACCGRCTLSLYLSQSVCMVLLFRWVNPHWFGTLDRTTLSVIAACFVTLQLFIVWQFYRPGQLWWFERLYRALAAQIRAKDR